MPLTWPKAYFGKLAERFRCRLKLIEPVHAAGWRGAERRLGRPLREIKPADNLRPRDRGAKDPASNPVKVEVRGCPGHC